MKSCEGSASQKSSRKKKGGEVEGQNFPENWTVHNLITCFTTHFEICLQYLCSGKHNRSTSTSVLWKSTSAARSESLFEARLIFFPCNQFVISGSWPPRWSLGVRCLPQPAPPARLMSGDTRLSYGRPLMLQPFECTEANPAFQCKCDDLLKLRLVSVLGTWQFEHAVIYFRKQASFIDPSWFMATFWRYITA